MANNTVNKIDIEQLNSYIQELNTIKKEASFEYKRTVELGECSGRTVTQVENMLVEYQNLQDAFVTLVENTISYMTNRKSSVENMENVAETTVSE